MEEPHDPKALNLIIEWMDGQQTLMFATDYPHWDWDDPAMSFTGLDDDLRRRIFAGNAAETFGLALPENPVNDERGVLADGQARRLLRR
jgi:predicted TIM-barrel fold metal-dependent hydrolase